MQSSSKNNLLVFCLLILVIITSFTSAQVYPFRTTTAGYAIGGGPKPCLDYKYRPSNFTVEMDDNPTPFSAQITTPDCTPTMKFYHTDANGTRKQFFLKGVGYSPIFPSKYTFNKSFDYYTKGYRYLWNRDLDKIKEMGANTIRVWNWDTALSHASFLDLLYEKGLYILVPFDSFTLENYPDLSDAKCRQQVLMDWSAFLKSVMYYPAVFGYMIGNELNRDFGAQREGLFSIINEMIALRNEIDPARHPVTLPLADSGDFKQSWVEEYYNWAAIDFWSIQSYRPDAISTIKLIESYYQGYLRFGQALPLKPLVFTEFGTDALPNVTQTNTLPTHVDDFAPPREDQRRQATYICEIFQALRDPTYFGFGTLNPSFVCNQGVNTSSAARVVSGAVIMEWNDEWWKGTYADVRALMCPARRSDLHTLCAHNIGDNTTANYIHEEWLGITSQIYDPTENEACICPRLSYNILKQAYSNCNESNCVLTVPQGSGEPTPLFCTPPLPNKGAPQMSDLNCSTKWCATQPGIMRRPEYSVAGPVVLVSIILVAICIKFKYYSDESQDEATNAANSNLLNAARLPGETHDNHGDKLMIDEEGNRRRMSTNAPSAVLPMSRETHSSHFPLCHETQTDKSDLKRFKQLLRRDISEAFIRFTEVDLKINPIGAEFSDDENITHNNNNNDDGGGYGATASSSAAGNKRKSARQTATNNAAAKDPSDPYCAYFTVAQERLHTLIWDKFCSMESGDVNDAIGIIFRQLMEGYHIYRDYDVTKEELGNRLGMLEDLALYSIVQAWAGTINHAPEKICEIFEFSRDYFKECLHDRSDPQVVVDAVKDFHHGLVEIFRVYYLKVDQAEFSYDDINTDALIFRKRKDPKDIEAFWKSERAATEIPSSYPRYEGDSPRESNNLDRPSQFSPSKPSAADQQKNNKTTQYKYTAASAAKDGAIEVNLLPRPPISKKSATQHPYLEYHKQSNPEDLLLSCFAGNFFAFHAIVCKDGTADATRYKKFMDREEAFPLNGGLFTLMFNYGWIIRYILWQWIIARFYQPINGSAPMCPCELMLQLGLSDSGWMALSALFHRRVLGRFTARVVFEIVVYPLCFLGLVIYNFVVDTQRDIKPPAAMSNLYLAGVTPNTFYVMFAIVVTAIDEIRLMTSTTPPYEIPARFGSRDAIRKVRISFVATLVIMALFILLLISPFGTTSVTSSLSNTNSLVLIWPTAPTAIMYTFLILLFIFLPWVAARMTARSLSPAKDSTNKNFDSGDNSTNGYKNVNESAALLPPPDERRPQFITSQDRPEKVGRALVDESNQLAANLVFWGIFFTGNIAFNFYVLVPSVKNIQFDLCGCDSHIPSTDRQTEAECNWTFTWTCYAAILFVWIAAIMVSFAVMYSVFSLELLTCGFFRAKYLRVGNIKTWEEVEEHWAYISEKCLPRLSGALDTPQAFGRVWNTFVEALYLDSLLSIAERDRLLVPTNGTKPKDLRFKPRSSEALRRITYHLWSLESALNHKPIGVSSVHTQYREKHRVRTMPPWTVLVPCYNETVIFDEKELCNTQTTTKGHSRISTVEYLVHTYSDEWDNFAEKIKMQFPDDQGWIISKDSYANDLMQSFLRTPGSKPISEDIRFEIRWWASMRGQTLGRTIAGLVNWRDAVAALMRIEEPETSEAEIQDIVSRKCQILISHQTANPFVGDVLTSPKDVTQEEAIELTFRKLKYFEVVYNDDGKFLSVSKRVKHDVLMTEWGQQPVRYLDETVDVAMPNRSTVRRKKYNLYKPEDYEIQLVQRVGRLRIGEGKAENQMHALAFCRGAVLQAMDMNQYTTTENGFKLPYILSDYFGTPAHINDTRGVSIIPEYRILGFPEWAYTRTLSMVGEFMGAAEWCFVTITQRVLDWPLRIRAHYGHPDFFDAYWVRNRGGQSKASRLVNTNEDIFAAYEMFGRGDRGAFIEFLEAQKGRETTFGGACVFEAKLAQGGAQQVRSIDIYRLNRNLNLFDRYALFFSSLAFYFTNLVMAVSVMYYMLAIALFAVSDVSFHRLGLMDSAIAVPWLIQIGYVLALPYVVELSIQHGLINGLAKWLRNLIPAVFFFVFHLRTKMYFFSLGILMGKGGYSATGRGFGLDRTSLVDMFKQYSASHFKEALLLFAVLLVYAAYGSDPLHVYLIRCASILIIVVSWMWAPVIFNPVSTASDLETDVSQYVEWMIASRRKNVALDKLVEKLRAIHVGRVLRLVNHLEGECTEVLKNKELMGSAINAQPIERERTVSVLDASASKTENVFKLHTLITAPQQSSEDINDGFTRVLEGLAKGKPKLESALRRLTNGETTPDGKPKIPPGSLDDMFKQYWGDAETESWIGWYLKGDIMLQWEAEDQFFPGLINLAIQKVFLNFELYAPWIILASDKFRLEALWFLGLIMCLYALFVVVNWGFAKRHEHIAVGRAAILIPIPFAFAYYLESPISFEEIIWSLIMFNLIFVFLVRAWFGISNAVSKYKVYGWVVRPFDVGFQAAVADATADVKERLKVSVTNRAQEAETTNLSEENRLKLFHQRMEQPILNLHQLSIIVPILCLVLMCIGNFLVVLMSGWVTTMNLNGRVSEAWKKAYLRPTMTIDPEAQEKKKADAAKEAAGNNNNNVQNNNQIKSPNSLTLNSSPLPSADNITNSQANMFMNNNNNNNMNASMAGMPRSTMIRGGTGDYTLMNRDLELQQTYAQEVEASVGGSIAASLISHAGASMRAVRSRRATVGGGGMGVQAASQSVLGREAVSQNFFGRREDGGSDLVSNHHDGVEPFTNTASRILMGDQQGTSTRNLGRRL